MRDRLVCWADYSERGAMLAPLFFSVFNLELEALFV